MEKMGSGTVQGAAEGQIFTSEGSCFFSQSFNTVSMRVCQPCPVDWKASSTSTEYSMVIAIFLSSESVSAGLLECDEGIYTNRICSFLPVASANFFNVAYEGPAWPEAKLLSMRVMAVALVPMRSATCAWVSPADLRAASISSSSANSPSMASYSALNAGFFIHSATISSWVLVGGVRLPVMFNLSHSGLGFLEFCWWGFLCLLNEAVKHNDTSTHQCAIEHSRDAFSTLDAKLEQSIAKWAGMWFSEIPAVSFHALNKVRIPGSHSQRKMINFIFDFGAVVFNRIFHVAKHNIIVMLSQVIAYLIFGSYSSSAAAKSVAGIGVPEIIRAHDRAIAVFLCAMHGHIRIMVGRVGASSEAPGSRVTGYANPARLTTLEIGVSGGEFEHLSLEDAYMATIPAIAQPEITIINGQVVTTSTAIADYFGKRHDNVVQKIKNLECSPKFAALNFKVSEYTDATGRKLPCYQITRDGFAFLAMGFTGKRAAQFKEAYITAFNQMEKALIRPVDTSTTAHNAHVAYLYMAEIHRVWMAQLYPMLVASQSPIATSLYDYVNDAAFVAGLVDRSLNGGNREVRK